MKISLARFGRRILAFVTDMVMTLMLLLCVQTLVAMPIAVSVCDYEESVERYSEIRRSSHLFETVDGKFTLISKNYDENLTYFYEVYVGDSTEYNKAKMESGLFELKDGKYVERISATSTQLKEFYEKELYDAELVLYNDDEVIELTSLITSVTVWTLIGSLIFSLTIFFLVFPLCLKNGSTLGKMIFGYGLTNKQGYKVKYRQIILRFFVFLILEVLLSIFLLGIPLFVSFTMVAFSKYGTSLHDYFAYTVVADLKGVTVYVNEEELIEDYKRIKGSKNFTIHDDRNITK